MLCHKCQNIHFKRLEDCEIIQQEPARLVGDSSHDIHCIVVYFHHKSKNDLKASADRGCHFCAMLWGCLFEGKGTQILAHHCFTRGEVFLRRVVFDKWISEEGSFEEWNESDWIYASCDGRQVVTTSRYYDGQQYSLANKVFVLANVRLLRASVVHAGSIDILY